MKKNLNSNESVAVYLSVLSGILILSLFVLILFPFDYLLEVKKITSRQFDAACLLILFFLSSFFSIITIERKINFKIFIVIVSITLLTMVFGSRVYRNKKGERMSHLRIIQVIPQKGIQAQKITIRGLYFGNDGPGGKVILDGEPVKRIISWSDDSIVIEQPVPQRPVPKRFGWVDLYIIRSDGRFSNKIKYEILNPDIFRN